MDVETTLRAYWESGWKSYWESFHNYISEEKVKGMLILCFEIVSTLLQIFQTYIL